MALPPASQRSGNRLLNTLPDEVWKHIAPDLQPISLNLGDVIFDAEEPIRNVYFPESGVVSIVTISAKGESVETGMVGYEGMAGLVAVFGDGMAYNRRAIVQIESAGLMMKADALREVFRESNGLRDVLLRYAQAYITVISQSVFCLSFHHVNERLARWLLECQFRARADEFRLTHEYIAEMIGVRRAGVTAAMGILKDVGLISSRRGYIKILDQERLESFACECCGIIRAEFGRLYGT